MHNLHKPQSDSITKWQTLKNGFFSSDSDKTKCWKASRDDLIWNKTTLFKAVYDGGLFCWVENNEVTGLDHVSWPIGLHYYSRPTLSEMTPSVHMLLPASFFFHFTPRRRAISLSLFLFEDRRGQESISCTIELRNDWESDGYASRAYDDLTRLWQQGRRTTFRKKQLPPRRQKLCCN